MNPEFFILHKDLPREGPGEEADVAWALGVAGTPEDARVLDAGCGPGADTLVLARCLPSARVHAVDGVEHFIDAVRGRTGHLGDRVTAEAGDMFETPGPFDLIWCAGAVYFQGVEPSLRRFARMLSPGGAVAFSEAIWLSEDRPKVLRDFWQEYAAMTDLAGTVSRIEAAGFRVMGQRLLSEEAWDNYFAPMLRRIARLRETNVNQELAEVLAGAETEISMRRQFGDRFGYVLFVVTPA